MSNLIGQRIGDYEIVKQLGEGGMGEVFQGRHAALGQIVAVKSLHTSLLGNQAAKDRFIREAQALARLNHPNIISLLNFINDTSGCFIIMEYAEGEDLEHKLERMNIIPPEQCVPWFIQACRGLSYAHQQQIIHRDIKPSNIIVHPSGTTKLLDFGTAKLVDAKRLTQQGMTLGTIIYMSKEQLLGKPLDARSDVYSLGVTLYECVTGQLPFYDENERALVRKIAKEEPIPPSQHYHGIRPDLEAVILKSMAKDPDQRYQSSAELEQALAAVGGINVGGSGSHATQSAGQQPAPQPAAPQPAAPQPAAPQPAAPQQPTPAAPQPAAAAPAGGGGSLIVEPTFIAAMACFILCLGCGIVAGLASGGASIGGLVGAIVFGLLGVVLILVAVNKAGKSGAAAGGHSAGGQPAATGPDGRALCPTCNRALLPGMAECPFCNPGAAAPPPMQTTPQPAPAAPAPMPQPPAPPPSAPAPPAAPQPMPLPVGTINVNSANAAQQYGAAPSVSSAGVSAPPAGAAKLKIIDGNDKGAEFQVTRETPVTIGRAPDCVCTLNDMGVSGHHATVGWDQTGLFVQDAGSRNGVFINNQRIQRQNLRSGDLIVLGSTRILINLG